MTDMSKTDGGAAFPRPYPDGAEVRPSEALEFIAHHAGMTVRDWFAGQALVGLCSHAASDYTKGPCNAALVERSFVLADAMIAAREES